MNFENNSNNTSIIESDLLANEVETTSYGLEVNNVLSTSNSVNFTQFENIEIQTDIHQLVFIDSTVEDIPTLTDDISGAIEVIVLDPDSDEVLQITQHLSNYEDLDAVHIVSHGATGELSFGNATLNSDTLPEYEEVLEEWSLALDAEADLLLYGCDVTLDEAGSAFVQELSQITDADISASIDDTGIDGDWKLETAIGEVEATSIFTSEIENAYQHNLADVEGSLSEGVSGGGSSTISNGDGTLDAFDDQLNNELSGGGDDDDDDGGSDFSFPGDEAFDDEFYLEQNPDVAEAGVDPAKHYYETGFKEGRDPNKIFDTDFYLAQNPDVAQNGVNPLKHYRENGRNEGRYQNQVLQSFGSLEGTLVASTDLSGLDFQDFKESAALLDEDAVAIAPALAIPFIVVEGTKVLAITAASLGIIQAASNIQELLGTTDREVFIPDSDVDTSIPPFDLGEVTKVNERKNIHDGDGNEFLEDILDGKFEFPDDSGDVGAYFLPIYQQQGVPGGVDLEKAGNVPPDRRTHILDGDATGGGHKAGTGISGKTEFPEEWSDEVIFDNIRKVLEDPNSTWTQITGKPGRLSTKSGDPTEWKVEGTVDGIDIRVIVEPAGNGVSTGYPTNVPRNP